MEMFQDLGHKDFILWRSWIHININSGGKNSGLLDWCPGLFNEITKVIEPAMCSLAPKMLVIGAHGYFQNIPWLSQWPTFKLLGITYLVGSSNFYFMVLWLSKYQKSREKVKFALQAATVWGNFCLRPHKVMILGWNPDPKGGGNVQAKDLSWIG